MPPYRSDRPARGRRSLRDFAEEADTIVPLQKGGRILEGIFQELSPSALRKLFAAFVVNPTFPITRYIRPEMLKGVSVSTTPAAGPGSTSVASQAPRGKCYHITHIYMSLGVIAALDTYQLRAYASDEAATVQNIHLENGQVVSGNGMVHRSIPCNLWIPELHSINLSGSYTGAAAQANISLGLVGYIWPSGVYPLG